MREPDAPRFPPLPAFSASYEVHLLPSTMPANSTSGDSRPHSWIARGFDLKALIARVYEMDPERVDFTDVALAGRRYDVAVILPVEEDEWAIFVRVREALKKQLGLAIEPESRAMDVYVVSAPGGAGLGMRRVTSLGGSIGSSSMSFEVERKHGSKPPTKEQIEQALETYRKTTGFSAMSLSVSGGTVGDLCEQMEVMLGRLVVDESGLTEQYDFEVTGERLDQEGFFRLMKERLGLVVTPGRRSVEMLSVRAR